ncbi:LCP family protein [Anaerocolumna sp.]|uniref:LCP family protein n=1 Tax=Anaerocolumna sp. TaxID=2041569 RepID=UPI0028AE8D72|nr:LCP family protein [Anaerocolumna sp.]
MDKDDFEKNKYRSNIGDMDTNKSANDLDQLSHRLGNKMDDFQDEDTFLYEINKSLADQVSGELEEENVITKDRSTNKRKKKKNKGLKIFAAVFSVFMLLVAFLVFTPVGKKLILNIAGNYIYGKLDYDENKEKDKERPVKPKEEEHVINILLVGVEEIQGASNTDSMIIATMNTKDKSLKLTSLMRDLYVEIPGYSKNRLNSAYAKGGIDLLYDTIKLNFGIPLDGYAKVNFEKFESIIDIIGGVEVTLTEKEASYLNRTNYISNPANRKVVAGKQIMNGNQALGYSRVRKVSTGTESNDFGRTQRQRAVLNSIFDKLKSKNIIELGFLMDKILTEVKIETDITQKEFNDYLEEAVSLKVNQLENYRIPADGNYQNSKVQLGKLMQEVLEPKDWDTTRADLRKFIYGDTTSTVEVKPAE